MTISRMGQRAMPPPAPPHDFCTFLWYWWEKEKNCTLYFFSPYNLDGQRITHHVHLAHPAPTPLGGFCNKKTGLIKFYIYIFIK